MTGVCRYISIGYGRGTETTAVFGFRHRLPSPAPSALTRLTLATMRAVWMLITEISASSAVFFGDDDVEIVRDAARVPVLDLRESFFGGAGGRFLRGVFKFQLAQRRERVFNFLSKHGLAIGGDGFVVAGARAVRQAAQPSAVEQRC